MNDRNRMPGPGQENPPGADPDAPSGGGGFGTSLQNVKSAWATPGGKLLAAVPAVVTLVVGIVVGTSIGGGSTTTVAVPGPTVYVTTAAPGLATATDQGTASGGASPTSSDTAGAAGATASAAANLPSSNPSQVGTVSLISLTPSNGAWQSRNGSPMINGAIQQFAIAQDMPQYQSNGDLGYNLGRDYTKFTGLLGLDDNSPVSTTHPSVEIDGDGLKLASYTPTLGHPAQISLNVTGVLRLDIKYTNTTIGDGSYNLAAVLIVGNGQLTTVPGYHPPQPTATH